VRLDPEPEDDLARRIRPPVAEPRTGPFDHARLLAIEAYGGPRHGEIEELLAVDLGERNRMQRLFDVADGRGRGLAGVVPTLECEEHGRARKRGLHVHAQRLDHVARFARLPAT
jgi:hypothetical protein